MHADWGLMPVNGSGPACLFATTALTRTGLTFVAGNAVMKTHFRADRHGAGLIERNTPQARKSGPSGTFSRRFSTIYLRIRTDHLLLDIHPRKRRYAELVGLWARTKRLLHPGSRANVSITAASDRVAAVSATVYGEWDVCRFKGQAEVKRLSSGGIRPVEEASGPRADHPAPDKYPLKRR